MRYRVTVALCVASLTALPLVLAWWYAADFVFLANESTAYRYFFVERLHAHETPAPWQLQGHTIGLWHRLIFTFLPDADLRTRLNLFGLWSGVLPMVIVAGTLLYGARLGWTRLALLCAVSLIPVYGAARTGWEWRLAPDYLALTAALLPLVVALVWRGGHPLLLGALVGLAAANKITLLPFAALVLIVPLLCRPLRTMLLGATGALLSFVLVFLLLYDARLDQIARSLSLWYGVIAGNSYGESAFWARLPTYLRGTYGWLIGGSLAGMAVAVMRPPRCWLAWVLPVAVLCVASLSLYTVVKRPASTTLYETATLLVACAVLLLGQQAHVRVARWASWALVAASALLCVVTFDGYTMWQSISTSRAHADHRWQMHAGLLARGKPVVVVIRDNNATLLTVEELLLKGYADMPTWMIGAARPSLNRHAPGMSFRTVQSEPGAAPNDPYPHGITLAVFVRSSPSAIDEFPALQEAMGRYGTTCENDDYGGENVVVVCDVP